MLTLGQVRGGSSCCDRCGNSGDSLLCLSVLGFQMKSLTTIWSDKWHFVQTLRRIKRLMSIDSGFDISGKMSQCLKYFLNSDLDIISTKRTNQLLDEFLS